MTDATIQGLETTFAALSEAWRNGDGEAFGEWCTQDVDFINLLGMYVKGKPAVAEVHEKIFRGPYKDSTVSFTVVHVRTIAPNAVLAIVPARIDIPSGPVQGMVSSIASVLLVRDGDRWKVASFHNTRREASQKEHLAIMRSAVQS
jgi:uncharacterized protein (TIGR02246 family)